MDVAVHLVARKLEQVVVAVEVVDISAVQVPMVVVQAVVGAGKNVQVGVSCKLLVEVVVQVPLVSASSVHLQHSKFQVAVQPA